MDQNDSIRGNSSELKGMRTSPGSASARDLFLSCNGLWGALEIALGTSIGIILSFEWISRQEALGRDVHPLEQAIIAFISIFITTVIVSIGISFIRIHGPKIIPGDF